MKCDTFTAFGSPLVPEVKISMYGSSGSASRCGERWAGGFNQPRPALAGHIDPPYVAEADALQQRAVLRVGPHDRAVGPAHIGDECGSPPRRVEPTEDIPAEACSGHLVEEL